MAGRRVWECSLFRSAFSAFRQTHPRYAVVALNFSLSQYFLDLWSESTLRIAADGGANRVFDALQHQKNPLLPHYIKGDLDSIRPEVQEYYQSHHEIILQKDSDQNTTDLQKCLKLFMTGEIYGHFEEPLIICGGLGGSLSHTMANIESIVQYAPKMNNSLYLLSDDNLACVLEEGSHTIRVAPDMYCAFVPLVSSCYVTHSTNLKYPLDGLELQFGQLVSTSNQCTSEEITVEVARGPLLFLADSRSG